jgi:hypothetical protein
MGFHYARVGIALQLHDNRSRIAQRFRCDFAMLLLLLRRNCVATLLRIDCGTFSLRLRCDCAAIAL